MGNGSSSHNQQSGQQSYPHWNLAYKEASAFTGRLASVSVLINQKPATKFADAVSNYVLADEGDTVAIVVKAITDTPLYIRLDAMDKSTGSGGYLIKKNDTVTLQYFYFPDGSAAPIVLGEPKIAGDGTGADQALLSSFSVLLWPITELSTPIASAPEFAPKESLKANEQISKYSKEDRGVQVQAGRGVPVVGTHGSSTNWIRQRNEPDETIKFCAKTKHGLENLGFL